MQPFRPLPANAGSRLGRRPARLLAAAFLGLFLLTTDTACAYLRPHLRTILNPRLADPPLWLGDEPLHAPQQLREIYLERLFQPLWVEDGGTTAAFGAGLRTLLSADRHGLNPVEYHAERLGELATCLTRESRPKDLAEAELLLSDGLFRYGRHLSRGRVDPATLHPAWIPKEPEVSVAAALLELAAHGDTGAFELALAPRREIYWRTLDAAQELQHATTNGVLFPVGHTLRPGDRDPAVAVLRHRLETDDGGGPGDTAATPDIYDPALEQRVKKFQRRHGLATDGVVGAGTRTELQATTEERRRQLLLTLERLRWLPRRWQGRTLVVNIADYALEAWQDDERVLEMRVIAGSPGTKTPVIHQGLERVEINPYWKVPLSIAVQELLPKIREDCRYLEENGFQLVSSYSDAADVLDPATVDWATVGWGNFPGRIRQCPGPDNALGRVKFLFPNHLDVYLHDTPRRRLFARTQRSLSHGCVRVQQPITLADYVLQDHPEWPGERIDQVIANGERHVVDLHTPTEVYLLYWTAWVDGNGHLQFRHDVYGRDATLLAMMTGDPGSPRTALLDRVPTARKQ